MVGLDEALPAVEERHHEHAEREQVGGHRAHRLVLRLRGCRREDMVGYMENLNSSISLAIERLQGFGDSDCFVPYCAVPPSFLYLSFSISFSVVTL